MNELTNDGGVSATEPDWSRERVTSFWEPGKQLLKTIRGYQRCATRTGLPAALRRKLYVLEYRFWSVVTGAEIPINCRIGGGLAIPHPNGIVIHPRPKSASIALSSSRSRLAHDGAEAFPCSRGMSMWERGQRFSEES